MNITQPISATKATCPFPLAGTLPFLLAWMLVWILLNMPVYPKVMRTSYVMLAVVQVMMRFGR
jgi:hypothetical protein